jgi:hypothetical protein
MFSDFVGISPQKRLAQDLKRLGGLDIGLTILGAFLPRGKLTMENGNMEVLMGKPYENKMEVIPSGYD